MPPAGPSTGAPAPSLLPPIPHTPRRKPLPPPPAPRALLPPRLAAHFLHPPRRLPCRHELVFARPDQIPTPHLLQRLTQHRPVVGIVVAQESLVQPPLRQPLHSTHLFAGTMPHGFQRVDAAVVHRRRR